MKKRGLKKSEHLFLIKKRFSPICTDSFASLFFQLKKHIRTKRLNTINQNIKDVKIFY